MALSLWSAEPRFLVGRAACGPPAFEHLDLDRSVAGNHLFVEVHADGLLLLLLSLLHAVLVAVVVVAVQLFYLLSVLLFLGLSLVFCCCCHWGLY